MAAAALIASAPSVLFMFYDWRASERSHRKAAEAHSDSSPTEKPKAARA